MKHVNKIFALLLIFIMIGKLTAQTESFYVYFKQNDKRFNITDKKVELKKMPFQIVFEYTKPVDIIVSSSGKGNTYGDALKGQLLYQLSGMQTDDKTESFFLNANTINLTEDNPMIWFKNETNGEPGFKNSDGRYMCYKNIDMLFNVDDQKIVNVKDASNDIYFVFIYAEKESSGELTEIQREAVKIKWVKEYEEETKGYEKDKKRKGKEKIKTAEYNLKHTQKIEKKEKKILESLENKKKKQEEKNKKKLEKEKKKIEEIKSENQ